VVATGDDTWTLSNTEIFAGEVKSGAGPDLGPPPQSDTEAFAKDRRKRATPPPPTQR
jgi:hypothetical protein